MKKGIYSALLMMVLSVGAFANNSDEGKESKGNSSVKTKFNNQYSGAENVVWTSSRRFNKATFSKDGVIMTAFYNRQNQLVATTQLVEVTALAPDAIRKLIKYYPGYQMGEIIKYNGEEEVYFVNLKNDKENFLVQITPDTNVSFFKKVE